MAGTLKTRSDDGMGVPGLQKGPDRPRAPGLCWKGKEVAEQPSLSLGIQVGAFLEIT